MNTLPAGPPGSEQTPAVVSSLTPQQSKILSRVKWAGIIASLASGAALAILAPWGTFDVPEPWLQVALFIAVATVPHWAVEFFAWLGETLSPDLPPGTHVRGFRNLGAYVGVFERSLFLGALVTGFPEFIAVWFVFKGIAGYKVGLTERQARRTFQLFLLNNAVSLAGVALGWMLWQLFGLPVVIRHHG